MVSKPKLNWSYLHRTGIHELTGKTIPEFFGEVANRMDTRPALVSVHQDVRLSYRQLADEIDRVASGFVALGYSRGSRIGIWSTNNVEWILVQFATARIGAVLVNLNPAYRKRDLDYALRKSDVECVVTIPAFRTSNYVETLQSCIPELGQRDTTILEAADYPHLKHVIVFDPVDPSKTERPAPGFTTWQELLDAGAEVSRDQLDGITSTLDFDDQINIQYTSGTTGSPKAVVLSHHNVLNNAIGCAEAMHFTQWDRLCVPVPFYHCFGMVVSTLMTLTSGACLVLPSEYFDPEAVLNAVDTEHCTALHGVPTMFIAELEHPSFEQYSLRSLRTGIMAGAPCPPTLLRRVMHEMHDNEMLIGYGQTETSPVTHLTTREDSFDRRIETVGTNLPHVETKVADTETGATLPVGEIGEICTRGYQVMKEYYADPDATAETIDANGWLHSGDLGTMDEDGYVRITGRLKDMIIRGGENIYPREIEDFLFTHPKVAAVAVFGIPDERLGEEVVAWILLHNDTDCSKEEIVDFCKENLSHFKVPRRIRFVTREEFPMTVTGKIQKYRMRELAKMETAAAS
ncbi:MAG: AMP-binding protein [Rhodothermales bacterium]|nr:AMP-binding protein [Rhodothermales bacterium]